MFRSEYSGEMNLSGKQQKTQAQPGEKKNEKNHDFNCCGGNGVWNFGCRCHL